MNKSDKYYLKQGKLELSMLEEDDEHLILHQGRKEQRKKEDFADLEFPHTKRLKETRSKVPKLKVTQDIYNTLHTMGQYLTKSDEGDALNPKLAPKVTIPKKTVSPAKAQMLEQIASTVKIQELELPLREEKEVEPQPFEPIVKEMQQEAIGMESLGYTPEDSLLEKEAMSDLELTSDKETRGCLPEEQIERDKAIIEEEREVDEAYLEGVAVQSISKVTQDKLDNALVRDEEASQEEKVVEIVEPLEKEEVGVKKIAILSKLEENAESIERQEDIINVEQAPIPSQGINGELQQKNIDEVLDTFFGNVSPKYTFAKELKRHIDKQISLIKNYK